MVDPLLPDHKVGSIYHDALYKVCTMYFNPWAPQMPNNRAEIEMLPVGQEGV